MHNTRFPFKHAPQKCEFNERDLLGIRQSIKAMQHHNIDYVRLAPSVLSDYLSHYGFDSVLTMHPHYNHQLAFKTVHLESADEMQEIVTHTFSTPTNKMTACLAHGLFDHTGLFLPLIEFLLSHDINVVIADFPGHGLSSGPRAAIRDFSDYAQVVRELAFEARGKFHHKVVAVGQSTGGSAVLHAQWPMLAGKPDLSSANFDRIALLAPLVYSKGWRFVHFTSLLFGWCVAKTVRTFSKNSHNASFCQFVKKSDPLQPRAISMLWVRAMRRWARRVNRYTKRGTPLDGGFLMLQGTGDAAVAGDKNAALLQKIFPDAQINTIEACRHHMVNESEAYRDDMFASLLAYLKG